MSALLLRLPKLLPKSLQKPAQQAIENMPQDVLGVTPELVRNWTPSLATWGAAGGAALLFLTEWKLVLQYAPFIGDRYKTQEAAAE
ncbi:hypothetical protein CAOG_07653 [Capsaspora owczarzaki ATCC 30864]|uniref:hypothetical protein n=1 Tax=Capsaspora owczarzaki (strain ATCC 30864) TaxID=595528 RepID=UPI0001FE304F|nr:hypothetical protein CAOG_07653 [Capsaspora owczarzaki ATCC 30864]|eukprot:XP_004343527.1 hypothetical protein CAOG_07653 [Capsaspora owczarzaki ATCC 30864]